MSTLYDDDILLWSEQQAAAIRRLGRSAREIPNELDIENVAEEIESVGRSELAAVALRPRKYKTVRRWREALARLKRQTLHWARLRTA